MNFPPNGYFIDPLLFIEMIILSPTALWCHLCYKLNDYICEVCFWTFCSDLSIHPYSTNATLSSSLMQHRKESWYVVGSFPALVFFLQMILAFLGFLQFYMNFRTSLLIFAGKIYWEFDDDYIVPTN